MYKIKDKKHQKPQLQFFSEKKNSVDFCSLDK